jgi:hypothetical protein
MKRCHGAAGAVYLRNQAEDVMTEEPPESDPTKMVWGRVTPDEVVAHERAKYLDVQLRAMLQLRFPQVCLTYDVLLALSRERPMQDLLFACFLMIENLLRVVNTHPIDRELHYRILSDLSQDIIKKLTVPPQTPDAQAPVAPEKPPE